MQNQLVANFAHKRSLGLVEPSGFHADRRGSAHKTGQSIFSLTVQAKHALFSCLIA
jgi:hypothetical protein